MSALTPQPRRSLIDPLQCFIIYLILYPKGLAVFTVLDHFGVIGKEWHGV
jgi:hypothetical protein